uniref:Capsid protein n=1 Tax=Cassia yellow mosaic-associated virus TaxID=1127492 RepID=H2D5P2_9VIRU|nr:coat protein [Cassia yellow mosaic-associated virus]
MTTNNHTLATQPPINTKSDVLPLQSGSPPPTISLPFQVLIASLGTKDVSDSISIAANAAISALSSCFRHATLSSLRATIHPSAIAVSNPTTVSLVWVPANSTATPSQILNVFGGQTFCVGGAMQSTTPIDVPCNLSNVNPILKSSVTFSDTPKLLLESKTLASPPTSPTCTVTISGFVQLHSPLLQSSS